MIIQYQDPPISYEKVTNKRKMSQLHFHYQHELYYLVSGDTKYIVADEIFHLFPGNFIFIPKEVVHKTDSESCLHNERILLSIEDTVFDDDSRKLLHELTAHKLIHIPENKLPVVEDLLRKLQLEARQEDAFSDGLRKLYILELLTLLCRLRYDYVPKLSETEKLMHAVAEYIKENYSQDLSLMALSRRFAVSESCLSRRFKAVCGIGLNEYITNVRIHNAEQLLMENLFSVTQVAERCGFNDSNYFATVFKKMKGTTPLKYGKSQWKTQILD